MTLLVLASTSPFRKMLLERLGIPFRTAAADVEETRREGESPTDLALRLSETKARAIAGDYPDALIIGADQVAVIHEVVLGKPGSRERAIAQLQQASGRTVLFYTGLCLLNAASGRLQLACEPFRVHFRDLTEEQIAGYIDREQPFNCAGSFKSEGLGIALFERLEGEDPTALIGLPLIRLTGMLQAEGLDVLTAPPESEGLS